MFINKLIIILILTLGVLGAKAQIIEAKRLKTQRSDTMKLIERIGFLDEDKIEYDGSIISLKWAKDLNWDYSTAYLYFKKAHNMRKWNIFWVVCFPVTPLMAIPLLPGRQEKMRRYKLKGIEIHNNETTKNQYRYDLRK